MLTYLGQLLHFKNFIFPVTAPIFTVISARVFIKEPICKLDLFNIVLVIIGITFIVKPPFIFGNYDVYKAVRFDFILH